MSLQHLKPSAIAISTLFLLQTPQPWVGERSAEICPPGALGVLRNKTTTQTISKWKLYFWAWNPFCRAFSGCWYLLTCCILIVWLKCLHMLPLFLLNTNRYSGIPIFWTSKGEGNWFEKLAVKLQFLSEAYLRETTLGSKDWEFRKIEYSKNRIPLYYCITSWLNSSLLYVVLISWDPCGSGDEKELRN